MKKLSVALLCLSALASNAFGAWQFNGVWNGYGFKVTEYTRNQAVLTWDDGATGFVAYYNPRPNPAPRCPCSVYEAPGRRLIIENYYGRPSGGWYRGTPFRIVGTPVEFTQR